MHKKNKLKKGFLLPDHRFPVTRRELIQQGFLDGVGMLMLPSALELLLKPMVARADGTDCNLSSTTLSCGIRVPYLELDLRGGPQRIVEPRLMDGTSFLSASAYRATMGEPSMPTFDMTFGAPIKANHKVLAGIRAVATATGQSRILTNTVAVGLFSDSIDDKPDNRFNPCNIMSEIICAQYICTTLGTDNTFWGGYHQGPVCNPQNKALYVANVDAVQKSFGFGDAINSLTRNQQEAILKAIKRLNNEELARLSAMTGGAQLCSQFNCAIDARAAQLASSVELDPRRDPTIASIFGLSSATAADDWWAIVALIVASVLRRCASTGVITIAGCDYHYGARAVSDEKDREIGTTIGRILATASALNTPILIGAFGDGSVSAAHGSRDWSADYSKNGGQALFYFDPASRPTCLQTDYQVGHYIETDGRGVIDTSTYIGDSPQRVAYATILNLLHMNYGQDYEARFRNYVNKGEFADNQLGNHLLF